MAVFAVFLDWHTKQKTGTRQIAIPLPLSHSLSLLFPFNMKMFFSLSFRLKITKCTVQAASVPYVILYRIAHDTLFMLTEKRRGESACERERERERAVHRSAYINKHVIA